MNQAISTQAYDDTLEIVNACSALNRAGIHQFGPGAKLAERINTLTKQRDEAQKEVERLRGILTQVRCTSIWSTSQRGDPMNRVILSTKLLIGDGTFECREITPDEATNWLALGPVENYCGHATVRILGLEPDRSRRECEGYDEALCLKPRSRLEFGREYSQEEIAAIGVEYALIRRIITPADILALAAKLPTGLDDPKSMVKYRRERQELEEALDDGDALGAILEAVDSTYYAIKADYNHLIGRAERDYLIAQAAREVALPVEHILRACAAKSLRAQPGNIKDDEAERSAVGTALGLDREAQ